MLAKCNQYFKVFWKLLKQFRKYYRTSNYGTALVFCSNINLFHNIINPFLFYSNKSSKVPINKVIRMFYLMFINVVSSVWRVGTLGRHEPPLCSMRASQICQSVRATEMRMRNTSKCDCVLQEIFQNLSL